MKINFTISELAAIKECILKYDENQLTEAMKNVLYKIVEIFKYEEIDIETINFLKYNKCEICGNKALNSICKNCQIISEY